MEVVFRRVLKSLFAKNNANDSPWQKRTRNQTMAKRTQEK